MFTLLVAGSWFGGKALLSPEGRYWTAQNVWRGKTSRLKPVLEEAMGRAARDLRLPAPPPQLFCAPDSLGDVICRSVVELPANVSPIQANAAFTRELTDLGTELLTGHEGGDGTVRLRFQAGEGTLVVLDLVGVATAGLDSVVTPAPDLPEVPITCRLALIVNEFGEDAELSRRFAALPGRLSMAVHPEIDDPGGWSARAREAGNEVLIHLPMEPRNFPNYDPGPNAILVDLPGHEIRRLVGRAFDRVEGAIAVKTYMGQLAVEDRDVMRAVLEEVHERGVFFIDTTDETFSTVGDLAREIGIEVLEVPDDGRPQIDRGKGDPGTIGIRFDDFISHARRDGYAIGVVHVKEGTLEVLAERLPRLAREGVVVTGLGDVMRALPPR